MLVGQPPKYKIDILYGQTELKELKKFEGGKMVTYSYSIHRDREGKEISRTEPTPISSLGWSDNKPFTDTDYQYLKQKR